MTSAEPKALERLQAVVLLAGSVRATRLREAIRRSMLDLPIDTGLTLLQYWQTQASQLAEAVGLKRLAVRVMVDREAQEPAAPPAQEGVVLSVERDPHDFRGTGGVLKDLSKGYAPQDYILIANAHQLLLQDLVTLAEQISGDHAADVVMTSHRDGSISSLMLVRCGVLECIADAGFVDMKEQGLPLIARHHRVDVVELSRPSGMPIRTTADYVSALRRYHRRIAAAGNAFDPWAEDWAPTFSIVEDGALIGTGARIHDSVVLRGAKVEPGAVIVRSVICPTAVVRKGLLVAEDLVEGHARRPGKWE